MWYALVQDEQIGPMPADEIEQRFAQMVLTGDTLVWRGGMNDWVPLCELPEFMHLFADGDKTAAVDFDTLFGDLDDEDDDGDGRTVVAGEAGADLKAAVDALFDDEPAEPPTDGADDQTLAAPMGVPGRPAPPLPGAAKPGASKPHLKSPFGAPKPPAPLGARSGIPAPPPPMPPKPLGAPALPPARSAPPGPPPAASKPAPPPSPQPPSPPAVDLGDSDFDALLARAQEAPPPKEPTPAPAPPPPVDEGTMELGDADLFGDLLESVDDDRGAAAQPLAGLPSSPAPAPPAPAPPAPAPPAPAPPAPAPPALDAPLGDETIADIPPGALDFGAAATSDPFEAAAAAPDPFAGVASADAGVAPAAPTTGPLPTVGGSGTRKIPPVALVALLVLLGGGVGIGVLALTSGGDEDPAGTNKRATVDTVDPTPPPPMPIDAAIPDAAPPPPDAAPDAAPDVEPDAAPDAEPDAAPDAEPDAKPDAKPVVAVRPPRPRPPRPRPPRPTPPVTPPPSDKPTALSRADIKRVLDENQGRFDACAAQSPAVKGKTVSAYVSIQRSGRIGQARLTTASVRGTPAEGCIIDALKALRFPEFTGDPMNFPLPLRL